MTPITKLAFLLFVTLRLLGSPSAETKRFIVSCARDVLTGSLKLFLLMLRESDMCKSLQCNYDYE